MQIYEKIKEIAKEKKITIDAIEKEANLGRGSLSKWNTVSPSVSNLLKVAAILNVHIGELVEERSA
jgi:transcriptional regulator with XRE-family HTH domain